MKIDSYNDVFAFKMDEYKKILGKNYHLDLALSAIKISNAFVFPMKRKNNRSPLEYLGGVYSEEKKFIAGYKRQINDFSLHDLCEEDYENVEQKINYVNETVVFGGIIFENKGYIRLDGLSRLWFFLQNMDRDYRYVFCVDCFKSTYIIEFLHLIGLKDEQIIFLNNPTQFSQIIVPDESVYACSGYTDKYLNIYDVIKEKVISKSIEKNIFITDISQKQNLVNNEFFEKFYESQGYSLITLEKLSLKEQIQILSGAKKIVCFSEMLSQMLLFCDKEAELTVLNCNLDFLQEQCIINQARRICCTYIDVWMNFLPYHHAYAGNLIGPNRNFINYLRENVFSYSNSEIEKNIKSSCFEYLKVWSGIYAKSEPNKALLEDNNFEISLLVDQVKNFVECLPKYHISIVGSCVLRDIFNSNFVKDYSKFFIVDSYFARTTIPSIVGKPIPYDINILEKDFNALYFEYNYTECAKCMLSILENNQSDFILLDFYADAYYGTYQYDDSFVKGSLWALKKSKAIDTTKISNFYNFANSPEEYFDIWCKAFDLFMKYAKARFPKSKLVINGISASNQITNEIGGKVISIQNPAVDVEKLNAYWNRLNTYCEEKYKIPVIRYDKNYTLDPKYRYGLKTELVHFHINYYKDAFKKILNVCKKNDYFCNSYIPNNNLIRNSNFINGKKFWSFSNSEWSVKNKGNEMVLVPCGKVTSDWRWIWCDPIEISSDGKTPYTLSFSIFYDDVLIEEDFPVFGIRTFKNEVEKEYAKNIYNQIVKIPLESMQYKTKFRFTYTFYPNGKFMRIAPHVKGKIVNIEFSDIQLQKGKFATEYQCAWEERETSFFTTNMLRG